MSDYKSNYGVDELTPEVLVEIREEYGGAFGPIYQNDGKYYVTTLRQDADIYEAMNISEQYNGFSSDPNAENYYGKYYDISLVIDQSTTTKDAQSLFSDARQRWNDAYDHKSSTSSYQIQYSQEELQEYIKELESEADCSVQNIYVGEDGRTHISYINASGETDDMPISLAKKSSSDLDQELNNIKEYYEKVYKEQYPDKDVKVELVKKEGNTYTLKIDGKEMKDITLSEYDLTSEKSYMGITSNKVKSSDKLSDDNKSYIEDYYKEVYKGQDVKIIKNEDGSYSLIIGDAAQVDFEKGATIAEALTQANNELNSGKAVKVPNQGENTRGLTQLTGQGYHIFINVNDFESVQESHKMSQGILDGCTTIYRTDMFTDKLAEAYSSLIGLEGNTDPTNRISKSNELLSNITTNVKYSLEAYKNIDHELGIVINSVIEEIFNVNSYENHHSEFSGLTLEEKEQKLTDMINYLDETITDLEKEYKKNYTDAYGIPFTESFTQMLVGLADALDINHDVKYYADQERYMDEGMYRLDINQITSTMEFIKEHNVMNKLGKYVSINGPDAWVESGMSELNDFIYKDSQSIRDYSEESKNNYIERMFLLRYSRNQTDLKNTWNDDYGEDIFNFLSDSGLPTREDQATEYYRKRSEAIKRIKGYLSNQLKETVTIDTYEADPNTGEAIKKTFNAVELFDYYNSEGFKTAEQELNDSILSLKNTKYNYEQYREILPFLAEKEKPEYLEYLVKDYSDIPYDYSGLGDSMKYLSQEEIALYFMCEKTGGLEKANNYLKAMSDMIAQRQGFEEAAERMYEMNQNGGDAWDFINSGKYGFSDGLEGFFRNIGNCFFSDGKRDATDYRNMYFLAMLGNDGELGNCIYNNNLSKEYKDVLRRNYNVMNSVGQVMIPALSRFIPYVGWAVSPALMAMSSFGGSVEYAKQLGKSDVQAYLYGGFQACSTLVLYKLASGIPGLGNGKIPSGWMDFASNIDKAATRAVLSTYVDASLRATILQEPVDFSHLPEQALDSAITSMYVSAVMQAGTKLTFKLADGITIKLSGGEYNSYQDFLADTEAQFKATPAGQRLLKLYRMDADAWKEYKGHNKGSIVVKMVEEMKDDKADKPLNFTDKAEEVIGMKLEPHERLMFDPNDNNYYIVNLKTGGGMTVPGDWLSNHEPGAIGNVSATGAWANSLGNDGVVIADADGNLLTTLPSDIVTISGDNLESGNSQTDLIAFEAAADIDNGNEGNIVTLQPTTTEGSITDEQTTLIAANNMSGQDVDITSTQGTGEELPKTDATVTLRSPDEIITEHINGEMDRYSQYDLRPTLDKNDSYFYREGKAEELKEYLDLARTPEEQEVLTQILLDGGYEGYGFDSGLCSNNNRETETARRLSMATMYVTNPDTFKTLSDDKVNMFHGTNSGALQEILKTGLNSPDAIERSGLKVTTGEYGRLSGGGIDMHSTIRGKDFVSFTDVLDVAHGYATNGKDGSYGIIIGTTTDDIKSSRTVSVGSADVEVGVIGSLPVDKIKTIMVPGDKVDEVKGMVGDKGIKVLSMDGYDKKPFTFYDNTMYTSDEQFTEFSKYIKDKPVAIKPATDPRITDTEHRVHEGFTPGNSDDYPGSLITDQDHVYRITGTDQVEDIEKSGYVRPRPMDESKRQTKIGHPTDWWSQGGSRYFIKPGEPRAILVAPTDKVKDVKGAIPLSDLTGVYQYNFNTGQFEDHLEDVKGKNAELTGTTPQETVTPQEDTVPKPENQLISTEDGRYVIRRADGTEFTLRTVGIKHDASGLGYGGVTSTFDGKFTAKDNVQLESGIGDHRFLTIGDTEEATALLRDIATTDKTDTLNEKAQAVGKTVDTYFGDFTMLQYRLSYFPTVDDVTEDNPQGQVSDIAHKHCAACVERAMMSQNLLTEMGVDSTFKMSGFINSDGEKDAHAYNIIRDNGKYYIFDATQPTLRDGKIDPIVCEIPEAVALKMLDPLSEDGTSVKVSHYNPLQGRVYDVTYDAGWNDVYEADSASDDGTEFDLSSYKRDGVAEVVKLMRNPDPVKMAAASNQFKEYALSDYRATVYFGGDFDKMIPTDKLEILNTALTDPNQYGLIHYIDVSQDSDLYALRHDDLVEFYKGVLSKFEKGEWNYHNLPTIAPHVFKELDPMYPAKVDLNGVAKEVARENNARLFGNGSPPTKTAPGYSYLKDYGEEILDYAIDHDITLGQDAVTILLRDVLKDGSTGLRKLVIAGNYDREAFYSLKGKIMDEGPLVIKVAENHPEYLDGQMIDIGVEPIETIRYFLDKTESTGLRYTLATPRDYPYLDELHDRLGDRLYIKPMNNSNAREETYTYEEYMAKEATIRTYADALSDKVAWDGSIKSLSPYEKYLGAYIITTKFAKYNLPENSKTDLTRSIYEFIDKHKDRPICCVGYVSMLNELLERQEYSDGSVDVVHWGVKSKRENRDGVISIGDNHDRSLVHIVDPKYGIDGIYMSDPTWDDINFEDLTIEDVTKRRFPHLLSTMDSLAEEKYSFDKPLDNNHVSTNRDMVYIMDELGIFDPNLQPDDIRAMFNKPISNRDYILALCALNRFVDRNAVMPKESNVGENGYSVDEFNKAAFSAGMEEEIIIPDEWYDKTISDILIHWRDETDIDQYEATSLLDAAMRKKVGYGTGITYNYTADGKIEMQLGYQLLSSDDLDLIDKLPDDQWSFVRDKMGLKSTIHGHYTVATFDADTPFGEIMPDFDVEELKAFKQAENHDKLMALLKSLEDTPPSDKPVVDQEEVLKEAQTIIKAMEDLDKIAKSKGMTVEELGKQKGDVDPALQQQADILAKELQDQAKEQESSVTSFLQTYQGPKYAGMSFDELNKGIKDGTIKEYSVLVGIDHDIKDVDTIASKMIRDYSHHKYDTIDKCANNIHDVLRYTMVIDDSHYTENVQSTIDSLRERGYLVTAKNFWGNPAYQGVNAVITDRNTGFSFELQFHTAGSYETKEKYTHDYYAIFRNDFTTQEEKDLANVVQMGYQKKVSAPDGVMGHDFN